MCVRVCVKELNAIKFLLRIAAKPSQVCWKSCFVSIMNLIHRSNWADCCDHLKRAFCLRISNWRPIWRFDEQHWNQFRFFVCFVCSSCVLISRYQIDPRSHWICSIPKVEHYRPIKKEMKTKKRRLKLNFFYSISTSQNGCSSHFGVVPSSKCPKVKQNTYEWMGWNDEAW